MANKLKLIHLFSGVGAPEMALKRLGIPLEIVGFSEIDKYAIQSYKAIHGDVPNLGSVTDIERLPKCNLLVYGSPCQDFSVAGKQRGLLDENGNQTRSGLLFEVERLLETAKANNELPEILLQENVKNLVGKKFKPDFDRWLDKLDELGYNNYWQVLNAKNFGIPQNRERVFVVSLRKDIDKRGYTFPKGFPLEKRLKDVLEPMVDGKYYLSDKIVERFKKFDKPKNNVVGTTKPDFRTIGQRDLVFGTDGEMGCLVATDYKQPKQIIDNTKPNCLGNASIDTDSQAGKCYSTEAISPTICAGTHGYANGNIVEYQIGASRGRNPENPSDRTVGAPTEQRLEINPNGTANTLTTVQKDNYVVEKVVNVGDNYIQWDTSGKGYNSQQDRAYYIDGTGPALSACNTSGSKSQVINVSKEEAKEIFEAKVMQVGNVTDTEKCSWDNPQRGRVYDSNGISPTLTCMQGGGLEPKIIDDLYQNRDARVYSETSPTLRCNCGSLKVEEPQIDKVDIPQPVRVRKYPINNDRLKYTLGNARSKSGKSVADIATALGLPKTKVEHWFRTDNCFAIPDEDYWFNLKQVIGIETDEFDQAITTFEEKEGTYEKSNRCYKDSGIAPTLTTVSADEKVIIGSTQKHAAVNTDGVVPTLTSAMGEGGGHVPMHNYDIRIRKLTPRECWRLMDFTDEDFDKAQSVGISNSQLYKIAGNSIVVACLYNIFRKLFIDFDKED